MSRTVAQIAREFITDPVGTNAEIPEPLLNRVEAGSVVSTLAFLQHPRRRQMPMHIETCAMPLASCLPSGCGNEGS